MMHRLAIVTTHPIQYYAPWFRYLAARSGLETRVYYLWDFGVTAQVDPGFGQTIRWDVPLLDGYAHEFVPNCSRKPATNHFWGINNPELLPRLRAFDPSAVLCLGYNYATFARLLTRWDRRRAPLLLRGDSHRLVPPRGLRAWARRQLLKAIFRRFAACLYVGTANRQYFQQHGVPDERLFFSPHAVDNERFFGAREAAEAEAVAWKRELGIPAQRRVILFVGKFEDKKRPLDLLAAFARSGLERAALLFVGAGTLEEAIRQAARGVPHVYFAPFQNQSQMPRTYAAGDLVVLPSYGPSETWGLCLNEAMCMGKPVIASSHVGCSLDLIRPGHNGFVFEAGDVEALAGRLCEILQNEQRLADMGAASRQLIEEYSYPQATAGLLAALDHLALAHPESTSASQRELALRRM
jgi:glycosyltransferase involved in cell wall biosynthesis